MSEISKLSEARLHQIRVTTALSSTNGPETDTGMLIDLLAELDRIHALRLPQAPPVAAQGFPRPFRLVVEGQQWPGAEWPDGRIALETGEPFGLMALAGTVQELLAMQPEGSEINWAPEFPLPIRPDGSHAYTSTYCAHGDHAACRLRCKTCAADCLCPCGHPAPEPSCPYDHDELTRGWGEGTPCRCQPHYAGQAPGCPEGCPTHNHGGEDVPNGVIGGPAIDEDIGDGDRCPACGCVVGPDCEACERDCQQGGTDDACRIVEVDGGPVRVHGGEMDATETAYLGEVIAAAKRLMAEMPPGPLDFDCPRCGAVAGQLCRRESGMGGRAPHDERKALAPLRTPATPEATPLPTQATGEDVPSAREMTEAETAEYLPRVATEGIDTPGCDCRHEGMGVSWHRGNCAWRKGQS